MARFSKTHWLELGQAQLKTEGPGALTLERMTKSAGKTRGSFYHHFKSRDAFLIAMIEAWQSTSLTSLAARLQNEDSADGKRKIMRGVSMEWDGAFERQLRILAAQEPLVAKLLSQVDELRIQGLASMIALLQPEVEDPAAFAFVQYAAIVGGQMLLSSENDARIPAIRKTGNQIFGLSQGENSGAKPSKTASET